MNVALFDCRPRRRNNNCGSDGCRVCALADLNVDRGNCLSGMLQWLHMCGRPLFVVTSNEHFSSTSMLISAQNVSLLCRNEMFGDACFSYGA